MKTRLTLIATLLAATALALPAQAGQVQNGAGQTVRATRTVVAPLTTTEKADLLFMREEEKLALDVYTHFAKLWNAQVFSNIAASEKAHFDAIGKLLSSYALADSASATPGVFNNAELQALYTELIGRGSASMVEALTAGGLIEEVDIEDLENAMAATTKPDIRRVYDNLLCGSRNHLRSFVRNLEFLGISYDAQHLSLTEVDAILASPMERCGR